MFAIVFLVPQRIWQLCLKLLRKVKAASKQNCIGWISSRQTKTTNTLCKTPKPPCCSLCPVPFHVNCVCACRCLSCPCHPSIRSCPAVLVIAWRSMPSGGCRSYRAPPIHTNADERVWRVWRLAGQREWGGGAEGHFGPAITLRLPPPLANVFQELVICLQKSAHAADAHVEARQGSGVARTPRQYPLQERVPALHTALHDRHERNLLSCRLSSIKRSSLLETPSLNNSKQ